ncbi:MAG: alpha-1,4-glucan--maltose-1-phosphate maltosyltransferase [Dehalococcoidales bacterium]|nr:alpha-1,4-glucan--maltose-1-phosphate maltosyltransferase [Dehalococcoidales bacterium]
MALDNRARVVIKGVKPQVEEGRFPVKRVAGQKVTVEADIFADGHDSLSSRILYRHQNEPEWAEIPMRYLANDRWQGSFQVSKTGRYIYTITAWIDRFKSWRQDLTKRIEAGQRDIQVNIAVGAGIIKGVSNQAPVSVRQIMQNWIEDLLSDDIPLDAKLKLALSEEVFTIMDRYPDKKFATVYRKELEIVVDPVKALFSNWYEMFPRSCTSETVRHGTFRDCELRLPYIAKMGFDVVYLPPIHPIGYTSRKGKNNSVTAEAGDPGTPWAIGSEEGGHRSVHPQLGSQEDFSHFLMKAKELGLEIALDIAFQCSPDHPYVKEHPEWFSRRPDGSVQYAENPPKKYQDIFPLNFESDDWKNLWEELKSVITFWIDRGVRIFRIDNPHTKSLYFWEWLIAEIKKFHPEVIFLAEAFTRPKVMYQLAQLGFSQSYTYFAWRNTKWEITQYFTEITRPEINDFFRPNLWPNTPDILTEYLQSGGRAAFMSRLVLAATLGASYGIYGPAFELCENTPLEPGSEEYLDSEKYELKHWNINRSDSLADFIARINRIRRENAALQENNNLLFHQIDNDRLICYTKNTEDFSNIVLVVVNLDPHHTHSGWLNLPVDSLGLDVKQPYQVHDLLSGARYLWYGSRNYVELNPQIASAHIFQIRRRIRTERDFDYYL